MLMEKIRPFMDKLKGLAIEGGLWLYKQLSRKVSYKVAAAAVTVDVAIVVTGVVTLHIGVAALVIGAMAVAAIVAQVWAEWAVYQEALRLVAEEVANQAWTWVWVEQPLLLT